MKKETARLLSQVCLISAVLIVLATCGICATGSTTYGPEEVYSKGDGKFGYGADAVSSNTDKLALMVGVGGPMFIFLLIASAKLYGYSHDLEYSVPDYSSELDVHSGEWKTSPGDQPKDFSLNEELLIDGDGSPKVFDPMFIEALQFVVAKRRASTALIQEHMDIGVRQAAALLSEMVEAGFVGSPIGGSGARPILGRAYEYLYDLEEEPSLDEDELGTPNFPK